MSTTKIELTSGGYETIEAKLKEIENLAYDGVFSAKSSPSYFHQIVVETKKLRQILHQTLLLVPAVTPASGEGDAA